MKVLYRPAFIQIKNGMWKISCVIFNEDGNQIEKINSDEVFETKEQADELMRIYCEKKGYIIN